jgi:KipI family sensor histidine kinase inhibitor
MRCEPASEGALLITLADEVRPDALAQVHRLLAVLDSAPLAGIRDITPAYTSLLVQFDPRTLTASAVAEHVQFCFERIGNFESQPVDTKEVPVFYGGDYGPDLGPAAEMLRLTATQLVEAHCTQTFTVAFFGFVPGFAYLEGWPAKLALPRLDTPRPKVLGGSVALAGTQCGIYPRESPGGWRLIGRTPLEVRSAAANRFSIFDLGMKIRFYPAKPALR